MDWLEVKRGSGPLLLTLPHTGLQIPGEIESALVSPWLARKDADWWLEKLYDFAAELEVTTVRTRVSRTVIDVNRDPSGQSLYPGQATTELCPTVTFDGEPLYRAGQEPDASEIERRRTIWFEPYHRAIEAEIERLRALHGTVVLYDAHSIRSVIPRLFAGPLPHLNIGTNFGQTCAEGLAEVVVEVCARSRFDHVRDGRFRGGWTVRHYGSPETQVHAIQMETACRTYMDEPTPVNEANWPPAYNAERAEASREVLRAGFERMLRWASLA